MTTETAFLKRRRAGLSSALPAEDSVALHIEDMDVSSGCVVNVSTSICQTRMDSVSISQTDSVCQIVNAIGVYQFTFNLRRIPVWSTKHQKELEFQERKQHKAMVHAYAEGALLPEEVSDSIRDVIGAKKQQIVFEKGVVAKERAIARENVQLHGASVESLTLSMRWGCFSGRVHFQCEPLPAAMSLRRHGLRHCPDIFEADVPMDQVVPNEQLSTLDRRRTSPWLAVLLGVLLMIRGGHQWLIIDHVIEHWSRKSRTKISLTFNLSTWRAVLLDGVPLMNRDMLELKPTGKHVTYNPVARQQKCAFHISDRFHNVHPRVAEIVDGLVAFRSCQWRRANADGHRAGVHHRSMTWALVTRADQKVGAFRNKVSLPAPEFVTDKAVCNLNHAKCCCLGRAKSLLRSLFDIMMPGV